MVNGIRTIYPSELNEGFGSKFHVGSRVRHETPDEGRRMHWLKRCKYNDKDEDNSPNTLDDKNYQASSQEFIQTIFVYLTIHLNISYDFSIYELSVISDTHSPC